MSHNVKLLAEITKKCNSYSMILFLISSVLIWYSFAFNPNQTGGGGQISPTIFQYIITPEPKVGLTLNQAANISLSVVKRSM